MKKKHSPYELLKERSKTIYVYKSVLALLHWDQETFMPPGGIGPRSEQIAQMSALIHEEKTSSSYRSLLEKLVHLSSGKPKIRCTKIEKAIFREWHLDYLKTTKLPASFIKSFSQLTSESTQIWAMAKKQNNFKLFLPFLEKIITMCREKADIYGYHEHPYDALLEIHEPCMTSARVKRIFDGLQENICSLLKKIGNRKSPQAAFLHRSVSDDKQREIGEWIAAAMPMDPQYSRLDLSAHPFSTAIHPRDSRITTRFLPKNFMSNIFSVLHEAGHSMYEMGLPLEHWGTPLCQAISLSVHESQSRWWETLIGRSRPFWKHFYPTLKEKLPGLLKSVSLDQFYRAINSVSPSFVRVEADEVTYCLHVVLRFEIEKELISGKLSAADLPDAWNDKFKQLFGIVPPNDAQGCLQDIHWSMGEFGYFPTYALGNILAAHLFTAFSKEHPDWEDQIARGELRFIRDWLHQNVHRWGRLYDLDELAKKTTGKPLSEEPYCRYLRKKYFEIYEI